MKFSRVHHDVVVAAVAQMGPQFRTRDVSSHPIMLEAHSAAGPRYHATIGRYLSMNAERLGIRLLDQGPAPRGAYWEKLAPPQTGGTTTGASPAVPSPSSASYSADAAPAVASSSKPDIGPQYAGDLPFTARMRLHQSWYRAYVLGLPYGTGPKSTDVTP